MEKRIAIITGAGSGIGRASALRLAGKGIRVMLNARSAGKLRDLERQINEAGEGDLARVLAGDCADEQVIQACIAECVNTWHSPPDIFLASAGRGLPGTVISSRKEEWNDLIHTNILGLFNQLREIGKVMLARVVPERDFVQAPLDIIVIGSSIGRNVSPFNSVYGATKFAAHGVTEALRRELGPKGIRVTLVEPGLVSSNFQEAAGYDATWFEGYVREVGPVLSGDDVAKVISFIVDLPGNVHVDNISVRPTRQSYP